MLIDPDAEVARLLKERERIDAVIEYLRGVSSHRLPSDPVNRQRSSRGRRNVGRPEYGPGLRNLVISFLQENGPASSAAIIAGIRTKHPGAPADSIRSEIWRAKQRYQVLEKDGLYQVNENQAG
jgi:hypothetical protein